MKFSVIVPVYNKKPYVRKALQSILAQSFKDFELIVVNDGSSDGSLEEVKNVLSGVKNARIINQANAGVSTARNNGVAASSGEYICFLDADDWWEPTFLEEMAQLIEEYPEAGLYSTNYYYIKHKRAVVKLDIPTGYYNYCREYGSRLCQPAWTGAVCMSKSTFDEFGGFKAHLKLGEDFDLWIRIALKYKTAFLNKPLSNYNQDVDITFRGTHHLHEPKNDMLWSLQGLEQEEISNKDYKSLIDKLRVNGLFSYYLTTRYRDIALQELAKVDWSKQPKKILRLYHTPVMILKLKRSFFKAGAKVKGFLLQQIS